MNEWILPDERETYELEVVSFITNKPPASEKQILWELGFTGDDGSAVVMALKDKGKKVQFTVNDFELLGKTVTFYAYIGDQKDQGAKLPMPINYKFKWFSWEKVSTQLKERINKPWSVYQGPTSLCGMAAIFYLLLKKDRDGYKKLLRDIHHTGKGAYNGYTIKPHFLAENTMYNMNPTSKDDYPSGMPEVDWLTLAVLRSKESSFMGLALYEEKRVVDNYDNFVCINWPVIMVELCKKFLHYKNVKSVDMSVAVLASKKGDIGKKRDESSGTVGKILNTDLAHLEKMQEKYEKGHEIIMLVDADMLDDKTSYDIMAASENMHWIVYEGVLGYNKLKGNTPCRVTNISDADYLSFRVFTWGEDINQSRTFKANHYAGISVAAFKSHFYGYIDCWDEEKTPMPFIDSPIPKQSEDSYSLKV